MLRLVPASFGLSLDAGERDLLDRGVVLATDSGGCGRVFRSLNEECSELPEPYQLPPVSTLPDSFLCAANSRESTATPLPSRCQIVLRWQIPDWTRL